MEIREGAPLPLSQATNIPREPPTLEDDPPDDVKKCDPDDPDAGWPYHQTDTHKFL